ncbi:16S rRNA (guanine(966)-N(2))-methyltransferase RsmD [Parasporobacterium paucivorans]|uniref:16S rRNA (Guanine966-N2)-methyltransferase n=1 Tax=Parasporobacterium paucivorans DSM 15970 TaxID=1122934 RepID=A0A1M6F6S1_9FIRM|nr:16S rRNA (guanine(966)-N(2))-methyltransferase RsmD [Parasporobacterium paucivorans]SHI93289.1 16S rRNA (guanine966-N2)-methyltransferase [Parasporobacterium paucivorans DSM 15970]
MRVIAGSARSLRLKTLDGPDVRPTTDRIKETLFNMIHNDIYGCRFLDVFAGSGAIGIEALSRGADSCYFVDESAQAAKCIEENLIFTKLKDRAVILRSDASAAIKRLSSSDLQFDIVFMDPPYKTGAEVKVLEALSESGIIHTDSLIIVEADLKTEFTYLSDLGFEIIREKKYKTNKHVFISLEQERK